MKVHKTLNHLMPQVLIQKYRLFIEQSLLFLRDTSNCRNLTYSAKNILKDVKIGNIKDI